MLNYQIFKNYIQLLDNSRANRRILLIGNTSNDSQRLEPVVRNCQKYFHVEGGRRICTLKPLSGAISLYGGRECASYSCERLEG